jgi:hypothetical protein
MSAERLLRCPEVSASSVLSEGSIGAPQLAAIKVDKNSARIMTAAGHHDSFHTFRHRFQIVSGALYCN